MASSERTPLLPSDASAASAGDKLSTVYFLERHDSNARSIAANPDAAEINTLPEGSSVASFQPRPVGGASSTAASRATSAASIGREITSSGRIEKGWAHFFRNVGKKNSVFAARSGGPSRAPPVKIDPKVFFANERTFLAWTHVAVLLAGASVALAALTDNGDKTSVPDQLYGVLLLPVSIGFILYAMTQYSRRASLIRRKAPGPYADIVGPTVLTVVLMLSIVAQFSLKLYTLM